MNRYLSQRLAAQSHTRQIEASVRADAAADAVDRVFAVHWRALLKSLDTKIILHAQAAAHTALTRSLPLAIETIHRLLSDATHWSFRTSRRHAETTLPLPYLQAGAERRLGLVESLLESPLSPSVADVGGPQPARGAIELALHGLGFPLEPAKTAFSLSPRFEPATKPLPDASKRVAFLDLLFPPPSLAVVDSIIYATIAGKTWDERLAGATRTSATPQQLAHVVGQGVAQGKTVQEIAKALLPVVDGVRSTARRIARTEALRVVQEASFQAWQGMGDLVVGYQIHAVLDQVTRHTHRMRNGTVYYKNPKAGQPGLDVMPHPPLEADGSTAYNCRCGLSQCLAPPSWLERDPVAMAKFQTAAGKAIGDPHTFDQWFSTANERHRREAVGSRRYNVVADLTGGKPEWAAFVNPDDGALLTLAQIKAETPGARAARMGAVRAAMTERRELLGRVLRLQAV